MTDEQLRSLAQCAALGTDKDRHSYQPNTMAEAAQFEPHAWVFNAMRMAIVADRDNHPRTGRMPGAGSVKP